ncbi:MAG: DNA-binding protein, partial [Nitrososphaerota archaeon]|nr:DNA-binding protein [Nitrososphaerota archaeon]
MRFLVGLDDTDSSRGYCTTYLAYRIAVDLQSDVRVLPFPRLVRLNPNIPFKTRGNAAVCLQIEAHDAALAFERISAKVEELSDVRGGANSGMVLVEEASAVAFQALYLDALHGVVSPHRARRL